MQLTIFAAALAEQLCNAALAAGREPRLHPNGFVQLDLTPSGSIRFHVWPDEPLQAQQTRHPIHDHNFAMESLVLCGRMTNVLYVTAAARDANYLLHSVRSVAGHAETILQAIEGADAAVSLSEVYRVDVLPGQTYKMPAALLHDSQAHGLTATIMTKAETMRGYRPIVAVPTHVAPDNDFRRAAVSSETLHYFLRKALGQIQNQQGGCNHAKDILGSCCYHVAACADAFPASKQHA